MESRQRFRTPDGLRRRAEIVALGPPGCRQPSSLLSSGRSGHRTARRRGVAWVSRRSGLTLTILAIVLSSSASTPLLAAEQYSLDLAKGEFKDRLFRLIGPNASAAVDRKSGFVRLPADRPGQPQVGIASRFGMGGDFEVTAGFEIIGLDTPEDGYGSGVALRLIKPGEPTQRAVISTVLVPGKGDLVRTDVIDFENQKIVAHRVEALPGKVRKGRLRVARTGTRVSFLISEQMQGGDGTFRLLREMSFGDEDIQSAALLADTGGARSRLTARLISLVVRADRLPTGTQAPPPPQSRPQPRSPWWRVALVAALAGAFALVGWLIHRRRRGSPARAVPGRMAGPAAAPTPRQPR